MSSRSPDWIAEEALDAVQVSGEVWALDVLVGRPYQVSPHEWACSLSLKPLHRELRDIHGETSLQALCLATNLARRLLSHFVEAGGKLRYRGTNEPFGISACFGSVGVDLSGAD